LNFCKPRDNYTVKGQLSSPSVHYLGIYLRKCTLASDNPQTECKSTQEIEDAINKTSLNVFYRQNYFDTQEFGPNPVKNYLKTLYYPILPEVAQYYTYGIKHNVAYVNNNWFGFGKVEKHAFYSLDLIQNYLESTKANPFQATENLFGFYFLENEIEEMFSRKVYTLFDTLSDLGGFLEIIFFMTGVIVFSVQKFYFEQQVV